MRAAFRKAGSAVLVAAAVTLTAGCQNARVGVGLPMAVVYKNTTAPLTANIDRRTGAPMVIPADVRRGTATAYSLDFSIPGLEFTRALSVGWGDMSLERALENGGLGEVSYGDGQEISVLRIFNRARIIVYGPPKGAMPAEPQGPPPGVVPGRP